MWVWGAGEAYEYYYLWCLTGVSEESGLEKIGRVEPMWAAAEVICDRQKETGCWTDPSPSPGAAAVDDMAAIRTCFAIMSLVRTRGAVVVAPGPRAQGQRMVEEGAVIGAHVWAPRGLDVPILPATAERMSWLQRHIGGYHNQVGSRFECRSRDEGSNPGMGP